MTGEGESMAFYYRWFSHDEELTDEFGVRQSRAMLEESRGEETLPHYARGEIASMIVALAAFCYGAYAGIVAFILFGAAFLVFEVRRVVPIVFGSVGVPIANAMRGFSIVTLFGAIVLLFL